MGQISTAYDFGKGFGLNLSPKGWGDYVRIDRSEPYEPKASKAALRES